MKGDSQTGSCERQKKKDEKDNKFSLCLPKKGEIILNLLNKFWMSYEKYLQNYYNKKFFTLD